MIAQAVGRIARRADGKYFLYLPKNLVEDNAFPFEVESSVSVRVLIGHNREKLVVMPLEKDRPRRRKRL